MINILIENENPLIRKGLNQIVSRDDMFVVSETAYWRQTIEEIHHLTIDVILIVLTKPKEVAQVLEILYQLKPKQNGHAVLVLGMVPEEEYGISILRAGAAGYLTANDVPDKVIEAIRRVADSKKYVSLNIAERLVSTERHVAPSWHSSLSRREFQVMSKIASGKTTQEIAEEMFLSQSTVRTYRSRIFGKTGFKRSADLIRYAINDEFVG